MANLPSVQSGLKDKLAVLKGRSSQNTTSTETIADDLRRRLQASSRKAAINQNKPDDEQLAGILGAEVLGRGVILRRTVVPLGRQHGMFRIEPVSQRALGLPELDGLSMQRLLFFDTETSGLSGGTGTQAFIIGLASLDQQAGHVDVSQFLLTAFCGEQLMLRFVAEIVNQHDVLVSYNGKSFDSPLLATRYRMQGEKDPFSHLQHLDLLHPVRRLFRQLWKDCRLARVESELLGFQRTDDLPGSQAPEVWFEWMRFGRYQRLDAVLRHNYWDLLSLLVALNRLSTLIAAPSASQISLSALAKWYRDTGLFDVSHAVLEKNRTILDHEGLLALAASYRRQRQWEQAAEIWKVLATDGCLTSEEQLAKYYEHRLRDFESALSSTKRLMCSDRHNSAYQHRFIRLQQKLHLRHLQLV